MSTLDIVAVQCGAAKDGEAARIIAEILEGARNAGADARRFILGSEGSAENAGARVVTDAAGLQAAANALADADHAVIAAGAVPLVSDPAFGRLRDACYMQAKWITLADIDGRDGVEIRLRPGQRLEDFRFPTPRRELDGRHRGLVLITPPDEMADHEDPFAENSFFLMEEILRITGFSPAGRILATGMYFPPIDENPILRRQAWELGRKLVRGAVAV